MALRSSREAKQSAIFIDSYIELKMTEVERFEMTPHPVEFDMCYLG
jgi:glutamine synthetase